MITQKFGAKFQYTNVPITSKDSLNNTASCHVILQVHYVWSFYPNHKQKLRLKYILVLFKLCHPVMDGFLNSKYKTIKLQVQNTQRRTVN